jgi:hypothetical protein
MKRRDWISRQYEDVCLSRADIVSVNVHQDISAMVTCRVNDVLQLCELHDAVSHLSILCHFQQLLSEI